MGHKTGGPHVLPTLHAMNSGILISASITLGHSISVEGEDWSVVDDGVNKGHAAQGSKPALVENGERRLTLAAAKGELFEKKRWLKGSGKKKKKKKKGKERKEKRSREESLRPACCCSRQVKQKECRQGRVRGLVKVL